jgi:hypothetical protein
VTGSDLGSSGDAVVLLNDTDITSMCVEIEAYATLSCATPDFGVAVVSLPLRVVVGGQTSGEVYHLFFLFLPSFLKRSFDVCEEIFCLIQRLLHQVQAPQLRLRFLYKRQAAWWLP